MNWAILVIGKPSSEILTYLRKTNARFLIANENLSPFEAHAAYPGFDYLIYWNACVVPTPSLPALDTIFNFSKINVSWDSHGRNYPHKTPQRYSLDFIGIPRSPAGAAHITNYDMLETQDLHILPKNINVCEGFAESATACLINKKRKVQCHSLPYVKVFDPTREVYI